jgi:predicted  nucleic acid-binding Zn-ribbon protein
VIASKADLDKLGIGSPELESIIKAARTYGEPTKILNAVNNFGSIESLKEKLSVISKRKDGLEANVSSLLSEIGDLEHEKAGIQGSLDLYGRLKSQGFDLTFLTTLAEMCKKYGPDARSVLDAVNTYTKLIDIQLELEELETTKKEEERKLKIAKEEYARFREVLQMAETLLFDLSYSISTVKTLYDLAKKYDRPEEVFKEVSRYGDLLKIEEQIQILLKKRAELEGNIKEKQIQLEGLRAQADSIIETTRGALQPLSAELTKMVDKTFEKISSAYAQQYASIRKETEEYAKQLGEAKVLEEELNIARVVNSIIKYPTEAKDLPLDYPIMLLSAVERICWVKQVNPKISLGQASITEDPFHLNFEVYLHQLIIAAKTAILRGYVPIGSPRK